MKFQLRGSVWWFEGKHRGIVGRGNTINRGFPFGPACGRHRLILIELSPFPGGNQQRVYHHTLVYGASAPKSGSLAFEVTDVTACVTGVFVGAISAPRP